jgi:N-methylhydantoinase A
MDGVVGIDVGGTFTDLYYVDEDGSPRVLKVPSTPDDPSLGLLHALERLDIAPERFDAILHGTTIATNAVIERAGARCALVTTQGFRDILELGRRDRPQLYGLTGLQRPLIARDLRWEVAERIDHTGRVLVPLDEVALRVIAEALVATDVEAVVVSFLHSYINPEHEDRARQIIEEVNPAWYVVTSSAVLREYYEFERTSTAVIQAYLQPLVARYAAGLIEKLEKWNYHRRVLAMQSNGGVVTADRMPERAANLIRSGPAAGVTAAVRLAAAAGFSNVITADMGGTSFDVAVVTNGRPRIAESTYLDFRVPLRLPMIDVHTIGAGGGSIASVDRGGVLQVGPRSAGSYPGPICFRHGGTEPTVTDANLVLGRIDAARPIGGVTRELLDLEGARRAFATLGATLGLNVEEAAEAVISVVNQRMAGRIRLLSVEQGQDPRDYVMLAFGGAGPLHGASLMREVGIRAMMVPPHPGVLCAMGCALADLQHDYGRTVNVALQDADLDPLRELLMQHARDGRQQLADDDIPLASVEVHHYADMAYRGQIHSLRVPIEAAWSAAELAEAFTALYHLEYGPQLGDLPIVVENLRTTVIGIRPPPKERTGTGERSIASGASASTTSASTTSASTTPAPDRFRPVYFGSWHHTPTYRREQLLPGMTVTGPAIVEQADTTTVVEPGMSIHVDDRYNLLVETEAK